MDAKLGTNARPKRAARSRNSGFSLMELVLTVAIVLILAAIALPDFSRAFRIYQLNSSATQLAGLLKLTRYDAIHRNAPVDFQVQTTATGWLAWDDPDNDGIPGVHETQVPILSPVALLPAGTPPSPDAITAALGGAALNPVTNTMTIQFDSRGAVVLATPPQSTYVFYLGNPTDADYGYRAVVLLPSGATQLWSAPAGGPWNRIG